MLERWRAVIARLYEPANVLARYAAQVRRTYPNRRHAANPAGQLTWRNVRRLVGTLARIAWHIGVRGHYRRVFWRMMWAHRRAGLSIVLRMAITSHHLITYARECTRGQVQSSNYSRRVLEDDMTRDADARLSTLSA